MLSDADKGMFKSRWTFPLNRTFQMNCEFPAEIESLKKAADKFYVARAHRYTFMQKLLYRLNELGFDIKFEEEEQFLKHPMVQTLFDLWCENIEGLKRGFFYGPKERIAFFEYLLGLLEIAHDPKHSAIFENWQNTVFGMQIQRPGNFAMVFLSFSFQIRPMKQYVKEYFNLAVITGKYELLFKRNPPYYNMLYLNAFPGERIFADPRGMDIPLLAYRLDTKFSVPIGLNKIQTRSNERFITCPVIIDPNAERERQAEIEKMSKEIADIGLPAGGFKFDLEGNLCGPDGKPVGMFSIRRGNLIQKTSQLNLLKAIPRPSSASGLVIRFNLLSPISVLIEGLNRKREFTMDEVICAWKCMDILEPEARKAKDDRRNLNDIIDEVLANPALTKGLKEETQTFIREIERLRAEHPDDPTEEAAWRFLMARLNEGKARNLLQVLCNRLIGDSFDLVFSLLPLLTGTEIKIDGQGNVETSDLPEKQKNLVPLIEYLKREIQDLLKNVFTKYLDISAATNRFRSEPILAGMIVEYCLNVKSNREKFKEKLKKHLDNHYRIHFDFLKEYLKEGAPEVLIKLHKLRDNIDEQIQSDMEGILTLIENTRSRLYTPALNSRLLCFIDPYSVDVQIGDFQYDGVGLEEEQKFIISHQNRQYELAEVLSKKKTEADKIQIERKYNRQMKEGELKVQEFLTEYHKKIGELQIGLNEHKLREVVSETRLNAINRLKEGNIKDYAIWALIKAHQEGGFERVEQILKSSPNLVMAIDPHLHHHQEIHHIKDKLLDIIKDKSDLIKDPIISAMLLSENFKDIVGKELYEKFNQMLADILKTYRVGYPIITPLPLPPGGSPNDKNGKGNDDSDNSGNEGNDSAGNAGH